jgi:cytochrome c peroxidase
LYTDANRVLHTPEEIGIDDFQSERSPTRRYRTTPLRGLWTHMDGGFYHDGRFQSLEDVVAHYDGVFNLGLTDWDVGNLVEYLKSL